MYNPFVEAAKALTCADARKFYVQTAIEHSFLTAAVVTIAAQRTFEAGQQFRDIHDRHIVPFTLNSLIGFAQFLGVLNAKPATVNAEVVQLLLPAAPASLPAAAEVEPEADQVVEVDLSGVTDSGFSLAALFQIADEGIVSGEFDHEPVEPAGDPTPSLLHLTVRELRQMAKGRVKSPAKLTKAELIEALQAV